jgi:hypothetical protein
MGNVSRVGKGTFKGPTGGGGAIGIGKLTAEGWCHASKVVEPDCYHAAHVFKEVVDACEVLKIWREYIFPTCV